MQFKDYALESKVNIIYGKRGMQHLLNTACNLHPQFARQKFSDLQYFFVALLCMQCLFYSAQVTVLPMTRISTHICFLFSIIFIFVLTLISLSDKTKVDKGSVVP